MRAVPLLAFSLLAGVAVGGCAAMTSAAPAQGLEGTHWVLAVLPGRPLVGERSVTLAFEGGNASGSDGCNRYIAAYRAEGNRLEIVSRPASTLIACPDDLTAQARAYLDALGAARRWRVTDGRLELMAADGKVLATLSEQSQAVAGTSWRATGINNGKQAVASVVAGTTVTLAFDAEGRASGSAGCNRFMAGYEARDGGLRFQPAVSTRMMCAAPTGVMEQERAFLAALETVATARVEGDRLELRTASGALAVALLRDSGR